MDNLLDKTGVKRLLSNIKDWVEDKFIDSDDKIYEQHEIDVLVNNKKLKPGKTYRIRYYNDECEYSNNIISITEGIYQILCLKAISTIEFDKNAILIIHYDTRPDTYNNCEFKYKEHANSRYGLYSDTYNIVYNGSEYKLKESIMVYGRFLLTFEIDGEFIYVYRDMLSGYNGKAVTIYLNKELSNTDTATFYLNPFGNITYLKDNNGNEAPFDFINLTINDKSIITGSNNIIKSFDPANPIFINGDNNIIINSQNLNIEEDDVIYVNNVKQNTKQDIIDLLAYGVEWDITQDDPDCKRIGNLELHKTLPITSGFRGCLMDNQSGAIYAYLNNADFSKYEDGTNVSEIEFLNNSLKIDTGKDFYLKSEEDGNKRRVWVSQVQIDSSWKKIKRCLIDACRSTKIDSYINGIVNPYNINIYPITNIDRSTARSLVEGNGHLLDYNTYKAVFYWLPVIEYATFNLQQNLTNKTIGGYLQGGLGPGLTNLPDGYDYDYYPIVPCACCIYNGVYTGENYYYKYINDIEYEFTFCMWRGFEQPFGDIWTNLDGIIIKYNSGLGKNEVFVCDEPEYFSDTLNEHYYKIGEQIVSNGYIKEFDLGEHAEIIPSIIGGSAVTGKCDYNYANSNSILKTLIVGGNAGGGSYAGLGCFGSADGVDSSYSTVGFRTVHYID